MIDLKGSKVYILMVTEHNLVGYERQGSREVSYPTKVFLNKENAEEEMKQMNLFNDCWILPTTLGDTLEIP